VVLVALPVTTRFIERVRKTPDSASRDPYPFDHSSRDGRHAMAIPMAWHGESRGRDERVAVEREQIVGGGVRPRKWALIYALGYISTLLGFPCVRLDKLAQRCDRPLRITDPDDGRARVEHFVKVLLRRWPRRDHFACSFVSARQHETIEF